MTSDDTINKIILLQDEIKGLKRNNQSAYEAKKREINSYGLIQEFHGIYLYRDQIIGDGRSIKLDSNVQVAVESDGQISYTTEVKGGGSRPTLTRIAAGGLIAGPLGAVIGATAQKKKKTQTVTHAYDNRVVTLTIASNDGYISRSWNGDDPASARSFATTVMNAVADYPKIKKEVQEKRKKFASEIKELEKNDPLSKKEKELNKLIASLPEEQQGAAKSVNENIRNSFIASIVGLFFCIFPVFGIALPAVALFYSLRARKAGVKTGKAKAALIMSIIGLAISLLMSIAMFATSDSNTADNTANDSSSQETTVIENAENNTENGTDKNVADNKTQHDYMDAMRKCTVTEAADLYNYDDNKNDVFNRARKTCEGYYTNWPEEDFYEAVYIDWEEHKNDTIEGKTLEYYLNTLGW